MDPYRIARDTWVIPRLFPVPLQGNININSMIIAGREPVIVDTGPPSARAEFMDQAWSIVDPADVRWVFLSHDDGDHAGNLLEVLEACPDARVATSWFAMGRLNSDAGRMPPPPRCVWVNDGDSLDAGDRTFAVVRPPVYDSPTTRGLFDPTTGVYWASDAFGMFVAGAVEDAAEVPAADRWASFRYMNGLMSPWLGIVDHGGFAAGVRRLRDLGVTTIASCHGPVISGTVLDEAFEHMASLPSAAASHEPGQADLDSMLAAVMTAAATHPADSGVAL